MALNKFTPLCINLYFSGHLPDQPTNEMLRFGHKQLSYQGEGGGKDSQMKEMGMFIVSLRGVNFRFLVFLIGCSRENTKVVLAVESRLELHAKNK